ncbi:hornerin-like isoform X1 [Amphibalanus amphitrite]|uniref:hornerin-like isoform X1 n=1 Tax=Amphibalanus amphitrite TaxID=1232801 RepID=UPI001C925340|nr:hornerin-like isoform X1 [Amphibalanus amphitrite]
MAQRPARRICLLYLGVVMASAVVEADPASSELTKCQFSRKELHTTVRSAAVTALTGICDPVEMEARLTGMEQRLKHQIEELKETLTKLFIDGVAYDYDDGDVPLEQHPYTGAASSQAASETASRTVIGTAGSAERRSGTERVGSGATLRQHGGFEAYNEIKTAADNSRTSSVTRAELERRTASSVTAGTTAVAGAHSAAGAAHRAQSTGAGAAGTQADGSRSGTSHSYTHRWTSSSRSQNSSQGSDGTVVGAEQATGSSDGRSGSGTSQEQALTRGASVSYTAAAVEEGVVETGATHSAGSRRSSSHAHSHRWSASSGGASRENQTSDEASQGGLRSSQEVGVEGEAGQHRGASSHRYSYERTASSTSRGVSGSAAAGSQEARAIGAADSSQRRDSQDYDRSAEGRNYLYERTASASHSSSGVTAGEREQKARAIGDTSEYGGDQDAQRYGSARSESRHHNYERRTSSRGSAEDATRRQSQASRAIDGTENSHTGTRHSSGHRSSSQHYAQGRSSSSRSSSAEAGETPYVDFGPGGGPEQQSWFPGTSRTTAGTGVPDLATASTARTGGFGFGAVGEPLEEGALRSSVARARAGGSQASSGDGTVVFRDGQTYATSQEARRPGSVAGGDSSQYATYNASWSSSGERQVTAYDASSASRPEGTQVRFMASYTPTQSPGGYTAFTGQQSGGGSGWHRSRHSRGRSRSARRRAMARRRATDTVSSVTGGESAPLSRYLEIGQYNDTVYEAEDGKQRYSYYWEINDFRTMMATWENHHSLRSPSFYVFRGGYRMYIRVFPSRQGGNVYLHTGLTQGEYDDQLQWPFEMRLRLSLLDHSSLQHDIRSRIWDPRRLCSRWNWQKPRRRDNFECVGLGFPQSLLDTQRFLLDGAVLIKLEVFLED